MYASIVVFAGSEDLDQSLTSEFKISSLECRESFTTIGIIQH